jgi:hypothetical protein
MRTFATIGMSLITAASISIPALAMSSAFASPTAGVQGVSVPARPVPSQSTAARQRREPHPEIRKAITALERAKSDMQHASHDFGGHRVNAIAACDRAIEQLRLALQYDKR